MYLSRSLLIFLLVKPIIFRIVENFTSTKNQLLLQVQELMLTLKDKDFNRQEIMVNVGAKVSEFNDLCQEVWKNLMGIELILFEQLEVCTT